MEYAIDQFLNILRKKWYEIPGGDINRYNSKDLINLPNEQVQDLWKEAHTKATTKDYFNVRGWYQTLYKDSLKNKKVLDIGSGFGIDGIFFALNGAKVTFVDIVETNLIVLKKICEYYDLNNVEFLYLENLKVLQQLKQSSFDFVWAQGSLINAPSEIMVEERAVLAELLATGGRWIELGYPKTRWIREGQLPFEKWGDKTDGGAPWIEWYDLDKLKKSLHPVEFETVLSFEFFNNDFIWFDLLKK